MTIQITVSHSMETCIERLRALGTRGKLGFLYSEPTVTVREKAANNNNPTVRRVILSTWQSRGWFSPRVVVTLNPKHQDETQVDLKMKRRLFWSPMLYVGLMLIAYPLVLLFTGSEMQQVLGVVGIVCFGGILFVQIFFAEILVEDLMDQITATLQSD